MSKWKLGLLGLVGGTCLGWGGCGGWPGLDLNSLSFGGFADLIQDVIFGTLFD